MIVSERFPRSSKYELAWQVEGQMGPNVLWLTESVCEAMQLREGMRVLDLGCGKALSSVFLAEEFGVQVWATDLWIAASENAERIRKFGVEDRVFPIHADARSLPFAEEFFDAIVSVDAFEYFGTDDLFLPSLVRYVKRGGRIGIANAGLVREVDTLPAEWPAEFAAFHTAAWWRRHWSISRCVEVEVAADISDGRELWAEWDRTCGWTDNAYLTGPAGNNLALHVVVGRRV
ncbi:MAG TPA: methyltransferase domain-containing protein [Actinomycetota bacterium]|nr:methyltransferase domain-containing protein [Actinomycetota bacterium]